MPCLWRRALGGVNLIWWSSILFGCQYYAICSCYTSCYCCIVGVSYVCFLEVDMIMVLCVFIHVQGWLSMCCFINLYAPSSLFVWSVPYVLGSSVNLSCSWTSCWCFCRGYGWFSERVNAVVGCSGSLMFALCPCNLIFFWPCIVILTLSWLATYAQVSLFI